MTFSPTSMYYLGIDFGTSGARAIIIDEEENIALTLKTPVHKYENADDWLQALHLLLKQIPVDIAHNLQKIAIDGTSSTVVLCDRNGEVITEPLWYNDDRGKKYLSQIGIFTILDPGKPLPIVSMLFRAKKATNSTLILGEG